MLQRNVGAVLRPGKVEERDEAMAMPLTLYEKKCNQEMFIDWRAISSLTNILARGAAAESGLVSHANFPSMFGATPLSSSGDEGFCCSILRYFC